MAIVGVKIGRGAAAIATNTAVGDRALAANTTGSRNTAFGGTAGAALTTGARNTLLGNNILSTATTSNDNVMIGDYVGRGYTGSNSVAIGAQALGNGSANTGDNLIAIGQGALNANASGANNTAIGQAALTANTTASNNTAVGYQAGTSNTTGTGITAIGYSTLSFNTTGAYNVAVGGVGGASGYTTLNVNTTGSYNTGIGMGALGQNTTASNNTAVGYQAGYANTTGTGNTFLGYQAGLAVTTSNGQTFIGQGAGASKTTGGNNTFVGTSSGGSATTGTGNTFIGVNDSTNGAGFAVTSGSKNTIIGGYTGNQGGLDIRTSSNYIVLSDGDGNPRGYFDNGGNLTVPGNIRGFTSPTAFTLTSNQYTDIVYLGAGAYGSMISGILTAYSTYSGAITQKSYFCNAIGNGNAGDGVSMLSNGSYSTPSNFILYDRGAVLGGGSRVISIFNASGNTVTMYFTFTPVGMNNSALFYSSLTNTGSAGAGAGTPSGSAVVFGHEAEQVKATSIIFPASQSASTNANTLDDYEEGTWTPTLTDGTNNVSSYYYQFGSYIKIGRKVTINCTISVNSKGSLGSGGVYITGLPFTSGLLNNSFEQHILAAKVFPMGTTNKYMIGCIDTNSTRIDPVGIVPGGGYGVVGSDVGGGSQLFFTGTYWSAS
jgi:hypothetical protein